MCSWFREKPDLTHRTKKQQKALVLCLVSNETRYLSYLGADVMFRCFLILTVLLLTTAARGQEKPQEKSIGLVETPTFSSEQIEFFESSIRPLLVQHCYACHSSDAPELQAGLYVDSRESLLKGGESGAAVVVGKPSESLLISAVKYQGSEMPPVRKLEPRQIDALTKWVEMGAPWPQVTSSPGVPTAESKKDCFTARS